MPEVWQTAMIDAVDTAVTSQKYSLQNDCEMSRWDRFVESHPDGTPFHCSWWLRTILESYAFTPMLHVFTDETDRLTGLFPLFLIRSYIFGNHIVSVPFSDYGFPLFEKGFERDDVLDIALAQSGARIKYVETRGPIPFARGLASHEYYRRHLLYLSSDPEEVKKRLDRKTIRYSIRKAQNQGIEIIEDNTPSGLREFARLNLMTRKKHGVPTQSAEFFEALFENVILRRHGYILLAKHGSTIIAGGVFLRCGKTISFKYNASDPKILGRLAPNHLLTWKAIERSCFEGYELFDFGRTASDNSGLMRYKKMWAAESMSLPYSYYPKVHGAGCREGSGLAYKLFTNFWRTLPEVVSTKVGPKILRYLA